MAKKSEENDAPEAKGSDKKLLMELRDRYKKCVEADKENRARYRENMRFALVPGSQWDQAVKNERGKDRVMYEFNEIRIKGKAIVNQIRANRPAAKITPAEEGDIELAEAMKAQIDQIQNYSDGDAVMDYAVHHQVFGGMGAERYVTEWQDDSVDGQDILIEPVENPLCLHADYACKKQDKSDARFWILASKISKDIYKLKWKANPLEFDVEDGFEDDCDEDHVWVAEYWKQIPVTRKLALLSDGKTVDLSTIQALPEGVTIIKTRDAPGHKIVQYICSGDAVLEGPNEWAGKHFPFNIVYGEYTCVDGKVYWCGLPEYGKDAQRAHNWAMTSVFETIASTPQQSTTWVTAEQAKGNISQWAEATKKNLPFKVYNPDPQSPGPPIREQPATVPTALVAASQMSSDALKAVLGMPDETLGEKGSTNSGVAIRRRQEAGAVANYNYGDNATNFMRRRCEILIDLIPKVKDTPYTLRVIGRDGAEKWVKLNDIDPVTGNKLNDLSKLKYDLVVTSGPSFATQRQEAAETYMGMQQSNPQLGLVAGDLIFKNLDLPGANEIAERLKATLPPQIQAILNKEGPQDPAVIAAMQQVEMQAQQLQEQQAAIEEQAQLIDEESAKLTSDKAALEKTKADIAVASANIKVQEAELAQSIAEFKTLVAETQAKMIQETAGKDAETSNSLVAQVSEALAAIQAQSDAIAQSYSNMANLQLDALGEITKPQPPKKRTIVTKRQNGVVSGQVLDEMGQPVKSVTLQRVNGDIVGNVEDIPTVQ